jgi:hypothetical protein
MQPKLNFIKFILTIVVFSLTNAIFACPKDSLSPFYSDTSYTFRVLEKMTKIYDRVDGSLTYQMTMKQYDSSRNFVLDSSTSMIKYSGIETTMIQKDDIILVHDSITMYVHHPDKSIYVTFRRKGKTDIEFSTNPMSFLLKYYKERKLKIRKLSETVKTYIYSVDFDLQQNMYLVTAQKGTDYILHVEINYLVPDPAQVASTRIMNIDYSNYKFTKTKNENDINLFILKDKEDNYITTDKYKDYKINVYGN